jgi:aspartyl-tRNA(Asn)/glutamyl-tRNA(Gln) amidotransferase subunit A
MFERFVTVMKWGEAIQSAALIPAGNLAGLPALSLPCGLADGTPIAIQLVGRPFSENVLPKIGREFQTQIDFHKRRPLV